MTDDAATDNEQLKLLAIFHYVVGGFAALFALFPVIHVVIGVWMLSGRMSPGEGGEEMRAFGWVFAAMGLAVIAMGLTFSGLIIAAGRYLAQRKHWTFCLVIAAIECAFAPFGTVLGVFTIIVLQRPSVKQRFQTVPSSQP